MKSFLFFPMLVALGVCGACSAKLAAEPSAPSPTGPTSTGADESASGRSAETPPDCGPENSLGGMCMSSGGKSLWPPTGPGCERLVACCKAMSSDLKPATGCLLAPMAYPGDCPAMLKSATSMAKEQGKDLPAACEAAE